MLASTILRKKLAAGGWLEILPDASLHPNKLQNAINKTLQS